MVGLFKKKNGANGSNTYSEHLIDLRKVSKVYRTPAGDFTALDNVDLIVGPGEFVAVIGKSGSGKSTLINMITGIDRPSEGEVIVTNTPVHTLNEGQMALWRGRNMGIVFQFFQLLPTLTVIENVMLPMDFGNVYDRRERQDRAMHLLDLVGVAEHAHKLPTAVSGGQQQRVAIARALANDPPIIVADEPTGNLDSRTSDQVFNLFETLVSEGKTILMVTHDDDQARRVGRTLIIADGEIVNEYLAQALPTLNQDQLLKATHQLTPVTYTPGETIIQQGDEADNFYIITGGEVEIHLGHGDGHETFVDKLGAGQYFGEIALMQGSARTASVRASRAASVELLALTRDEFCELVGESELTRLEISREIERRSQTQARVQEESR